MKEDKSRPVGKSISLEDLAKEQGVVPAVDLDEIASLWPVDDDPDELLDFILSERRARRKLRPRRRQETLHGSRRA